MCCLCTFRPRACRCNSQLGGYRSASVAVLANMTMLQRSLAAQKAAAEGHASDLEEAVGELEKMHEDYSTCM